jgi:hypothetical protein
MSEEENRDRDSLRGGRRERAQIFLSRPAEGEYLCIIQLGRPSLTLSGNQVRHEMPPKAAPAVGQPKGADAPMNQSREAHHPARPHHSPEEGQSAAVVAADWPHEGA